VVLGWAAGLLILLALPWFEPLIARAESWIFDVREQWRARRRAVRQVRAPGVAPQPVLLPQSIAAEGTALAAGTGTPAAHPHLATGARARAHHAPTVCPERPQPAQAGPMMGG